MFYFANCSFQIQWLIRGMEVMEKNANFSSISLQLCMLGQKNPQENGV